MLVATKMLRLAFNARTQTRIAGRGMYSTAPEPEDLRKRLTNELISAMKGKDTAKSTTIRSVLSEVYTADKAQQDPIPSTAIISILRKAVARRAESASQFEQASRPDLAGKERTEADFLQTFIPPLLSEAEIDRRLNEILANTDNRKNLGVIFKQFYSQVDRSSVDTDLVAARAKTLASA